MASPDPAASRARTPAEAVEQARRLFAEAEEFEAHHDRNRYATALKSFLAFVEGNRRALEEVGTEMAAKLDDAALACYRLSETDVAARCVDAGLAFVPGSASLLHHKALILLAQNRSVDQALPLVDQALAANPHDKTIWATKGDALRLLNRPHDAAEAYLHAQQLDAASMQYVERALRVDPKNSVALRMKLQLAKAHGGDQPALDACEALLVTHPDDGELLVARAELLSAIGKAEAALEAVVRARERRPDDPRLWLLAARLLAGLARWPEAIVAFSQLLDSTPPVDAGTLTQIAEFLEVRPEEKARALAVSARQRLHALEPTNLSNLQSLRTLAVAMGDRALAASTDQAILAQSPDNLQAMRSLAESADERGPSDEAFSAYRALVKAHPHEIDAYRHALDAAQRAGRLDVVAEFARGLLSAEPDDRQALELLARALAATGETAPAVEALDGLLRLDPNDVSLLQEKKRLLTEAQNTAALGPVYDELFRLDPTRYDLALERGHHYLTVAYAEAEGAAPRDVAARAALVSYERSSLDPLLAGKSLLGIARASRLVHDSERAIKSYQEFLALPAQGRRADVMKELGHALREVGRITEAEQSYAQAVELGLDEPDLFWGEVEVLSLLNQDARALRFVDLLLRREPQNPMFLRRRGQLLLKTGQRVEALEALRQAVAGAKGDPHVHFEVGDALRGHGQYADALTFYQQGLEADPKNRGGRLAMAETLEQAGRFNEVTPIVDGLLREDPNDLAAWKVRADAARSLQRPADLQYSLKAILLLEPHNGGALQEKARLHLAAGEKSEAYSCLSQLVDESGADLKDPAVYLELGDLATDLGRVEEANRAYERAAQLDPSQRSEIAVRRARLRLNAGRPDLALEVLDQTLDAAGTAPKSATALLLRADILTALERPAEAQQVLEEVRAREPTSPTATAGIARALLDQGKHAEAREFLRAALPKVPAQPAMYLLLAESEAGLGSIPDAIGTIQRGLEAMPKSAPLWTRLGELFAAKEAWADAAGAYAHALALDGQNPDLHLRAGFVAEKLGHPNEALALYERATQIAPSNKYAWSSRGVALLSTGRPDDAQSSFERALAIDSDFDAAKEGKRTALQRTRDTQVERLGREALLVESRTRRPVTKNDLFVTLHVPFDLLEPVLGAIARDVRVEIDHLSESELRDLESASYHLITTALDRRPEGIERRGFTLADVAALSPTTATLGQIQRLFGYLKAVLEADLRPENLKLTPDVEELARKALALPENQRTLFQLVKTLQVGVFRARLIKVVESSGSAGHAPLPSLDLGAYTPEFRAEHTASSEEYFAPENVPAPAESATAAPGSAPAHGTHHGLHAPVSEHRQVRCVGCGGIATTVHECGAPICQHCIAEFHTCPKCARPVDGHTSRPIGGEVPPTPSAPEPPRSVAHSLKSVFVRKPPAGKLASGHSSSERGGPGASTPQRPAAGEPLAPSPETSPPPPPRPRREKPDDEPRL
ncbi:MAG: tetratricopeptide repeat protein [Thermoplasmata archaeon]|nr:tetratricopeptide repeat protein [Thermoplasmata archaeon]